MKKKQDSSSKLLTGGIILGTLIGATAAYLASSKTARKNLNALYEGISEKAQNIGQDIAEKSGELTERYLYKNSHSDSHLNMIIGGIAGGILGVSTIIFLTSNSGKEICGNMAHSFQCLTNKTHEIGETLQEKTHQVVENVEDHIGTWAKAAQQFVNKINGVINTETSHKKHSSENTMENVLDWAALGIKLFQSLKK